MVTIKQIADKSVWEKSMASFEEGNFLHSFNWGQFHQNLNKQVERLGFYQGSRAVGLMLSVVEKAKRATYLTIPGGPLLNWQDKAVVAAFKKAALEIAQKNNCSFIRIRPQLISSEKTNLMFFKLGFKNAPMHLHAELTRQVNLEKTEAELLAQMRKTTRGEIRKATSLGIKITASKDPTQILAFYKLQQETAKRQGFVSFSQKFLEEQFRVFAADNQVLLYTATFKKKLLAQAMIIFYGCEADYHYGASTIEGRKFPGAHLIQWEAIKEAKQRGLRHYNLWGVAPEGQTNHRFYGVSVFKRGFGGEEVEYVHAQDLIIDPLPYRINWLIEQIRKKIRRV